MIETYGQIGIINQLFNKVRIRKGWVVINCTIGMQRELREFIR